MPMGKGTYGSRVGRPPKRRGGMKGRAALIQKSKQPVKKGGSRSKPKVDNTTFGAMRRGQTKKFPKKKGGLRPAPVPKRKGTGMSVGTVKPPKRLTGKPRSGVRTSTGSRSPMLYGRGNKLKK